MFREIPEYSRCLATLSGSGRAQKSSCFNRKSEKKDQWNNSGVSTDLIVTEFSEKFVSEIDVLLHINVSCTSSHSFHSDKKRVDSNMLRHSS